jgi:type I restriction enzyme S subunit
MRKINNNNNLPKGWRKVRLGEVARIAYGKDFPTRNLRNSGYPVYGGNGIIGYSEKYLFEEQKVIVGCRGANSGNVFLTEPKSFVTHNALILDISQELNPKFLFYKLLSSHIKQQVVTGSAQPQITINELEQLELEIPDLANQKRIADILSAFDDKIELNNKISQTLEQMAQAIFKEWFEKNQRLGKWKMGHLGDGVCSEIIKPGVKKFKGEKIYLATADVNGTEIVNDKTKIIYDNRPTRANCEPVLNSIWFAKIINTYKVLFFFDGNKDDVEKYILSTGFMGIKALRNMQYYLYLFINSEKFHQIKDTLVQGAVQEAITNVNVKEIKILIPPEDLINKFNEKVRPLITKIFRNKVENQKLATLRDLLLSKLMSGEIRV